jgi:hypothetical protein
MNYVWLPVGLALLLGFLAYRAGRVWLDTRRRDVPPSLRLSLAIAGGLRPNRYWWDARIEMLMDSERQVLLARETAALGLSRADGLLCPLCGAEVPHAWTLGDGSQPTIARGPIQCPACDFRLDSCRHCTHFSPGSPVDWNTSAWSRSDPGSGRCTHHKSAQPVEQACAPFMARRLRDRGYEQITAPMPIVDSFLPPSSCRSFSSSRKRLQEGGIRWPDARRTALLRLLPLPQSPATPRAAERPAPGGRSE